MFVFVDCEHLNKPLVNFETHFLNPGHLKPGHVEVAGVTETSGNGSTSVTIPTSASKSTSVVVPTSASELTVTGELDDGVVSWGLGDLFF